MFVKKLRMIFLLLLTTSFSCNAINVVFINPGHEEANNTGQFWHKVSMIMDVAAADLNIQLTTIYTNRNHILMKNIVKDINRYKPDYLIIVNEKGVAIDMLSSITPLKIPIFLLLNNFTQAELSLLSQSQKALIVGSVVPNNVDVGAALLKELIGIHRGKSDKKEMTLLALQGDYTSPASINREAGFTRALKKFNYITLIDSTVANWSRTEAYSKVKGILKRTKIDVIWSANDAMAYDAKQAIKEANLPYVTTIGGINWDVNDFQFPLDASFGGHVVLGAKALIMINEFDKKRLASQDMHQKLAIFETGTPENIINFNQLIQNKTFDFKAFIGKECLKGQFNIANIMANANKTESTINTTDTCD